VSSKHNYSFKGINIIIFTLIVSLALGPISLNSAFGGAATEVITIVSPSDGDFFGTIGVTPTPVTITYSLSGLNAGLYYQVTTSNQVGPICLSSVWLEGTTTISSLICPIVFSAEGPQTMTVTLRSSTSGTLPNPPTVPFPGTLDGTVIDEASDSIMITIDRTAPVITQASLLAVEATGPTGATVGGAEGYNPVVTDVLMLTPRQLQILSVHRL